MKRNKIVTVLNRDWIIFFIFLAAISIRVLYVFQILQFPLTEYFIKSYTFDQYTYNTSAIKIMSEGWIGSQVFAKEPLYPYFLAIIYKIFGYSHIPVYIIQTIFTSLGALFLCRIATILFNKLTGYITAFIFAFYSLSIYYDALLLRESFIASLGIFLLYIILKAEIKNKAGPWFLAGITLGFLMITRHNMLFPFILIYIFTAKKPFSRAFRFALIFTAGFFIIIMPVLIRNYAVSGGEYIGISKEVNAFWVGNNPTASGVDVDWSKEYEYLNSKAGGNTLKTAVVFFEEIKKRPDAYIRLYLRKAWMFFNGYEAPSNTNYYIYREEFPTALRWPLFSFQFVCALGILGVFLSLFMKPARPYIAYIFFLVLSVSVILFHIQDRFRLVVVPFFIIFASYSIYIIIQGIRNSAYLKPAIGIIISVFLYILIRPDLTYGGFRTGQSKIRPNDRTNLALSYVNAYEKEKSSNLLKLAFRQCNLALKEANSFYVPYLIKGRVYFLEGRLISSINEYKKAVIYNNRNPFLYNELAGVYYARGAYWKSFLCIKRALHLYPGNKGFEKNLSLIHL
ncbi:MAG: glycosyltransferase family 39 protein [Candidatus Omnitrophota bacterium]|nr:glycosyltransferase family 39 protein [Candidatus Omnitrophota bacterium]